MYNESMLAINVLKEHITNCKKLINGAPNPVLQYLRLPDILPGN